MGSGCRATNTKYIMRDVSPDDFPCFMFEEVRFAKRRSPRHLAARRDLPAAISAGANQSRRRPGMGKRKGLGKEAFTLIEVVVATAILTIGVAVVARGFAQCAQAVSVSSDVLQAAMVAGNKMEEWELREALGLLAGQPESLATTVDKFGLDYALDQVPSTELYGLKLDVSWQRLSVRRSLALATCLR